MRERWGASVPAGRAWLWRRRAWVVALYLVLAATMLFSDDPAMALPVAALAGLPWVVQDEGTARDWAGAAVFASFAAVSLLHRSWLALVAQCVLTGMFVTLARRPAQA